MRNNTELFLDLGLVTISVQWASAPLSARFYFFSSRNKNSSFMPSITIKILFFASAREAAGGITSSSVELDSDSADTRELR